MRVLISILAVFCFARSYALKSDDIKSYIQTFPWMGLLMNEVVYGPITVENVLLNDGEKVVFVKPSERVRGSLRYTIHADELSGFHLHHLTVGIKGVGAQDCVSHSFGLWDSSGYGDFSLTAPEEPGVYEIRFAYAESVLCSKAHEKWDQANEPASQATIGVIVVTP